MHTPLTLAIERARADWLAGDPDAWIRYRACIRQVQALKTARTDQTARADRNREVRRPLRPRGPRAQA